MLLRALHRWFKICVFLFFLMFLQVFARFEHLFYPTCLILSEEFRCRCKALAWTSPDLYWSTSRTWAMPGNAADARKNRSKDQSNTQGVSPNLYFLRIICIPVYTSIYVFRIRRKHPNFRHKRASRPFMGCVLFLSTQNRGIDTMTKIKTINPPKATARIRSRLPSSVFCPQVVFPPKQPKASPTTEHLLCKTNPISKSKK